MTKANSAFDAILNGSLSTRNQGFMLILPIGYRLAGEARRQLEVSYGSLSHPDLRILEPDGKGRMITVDTIRETLPFLASTASEAGGMKSLVILDAHRMNDSAANALLKPLEEPTRSTRIILLTDRPNDLPITIRSRCACFAIEHDDDMALEDLKAGLDPEVKTPADKACADALIEADRNPRLAADILTHSLGAWLSKAAVWLGSSDPTPPLPSLTGKTAVPLEVAAQALQAMITRTARGEAGAEIAGWTPERAAMGAWVVISWIDDISRAGIDAKGRLHSLLVALRSAVP